MCPLEDGANWGLLRTKVRLLVAQPGSHAERQRPRLIKIKPCPPSTCSRCLFIYL